jgi:multiple sugar transport system permease protein
MQRLYPLLKTVAIVLWSAFVIAPFLWALTTSFKTANGVTSGPTYIPFVDYEPSLAAWQGLFGSGGGSIDIAGPFVSSMVVTLSASLASLVLGTLAAYGLSRFSYKAGPVGNNDLTFFFVSQRIMPRAARYHCGPSHRLCGAAAAHFRLGDGRFLQFHSARTG